MGSGNQIPDPPVLGAIEKLDELLRCDKITLVTIFSLRCGAQHGIEAMGQWILNEYQKVYNLSHDDLEKVFTKVLEDNMLSDTLTNVMVSTYDLANDTAEISDVASIFMCIAYDNWRRYMQPWRKQPGVEGWRDSSERKDKFQAVSKFGFGGQRTDTIGVIWTSPTARS
jgi:hypothetical protein